MKKRIRILGGQLRQVVIACAVSCFQDTPDQQFKGRYPTLSTGYFMWQPMASVGSIIFCVVSFQIWIEIYIPTCIVKYVIFVAYDNYEIGFHMSFSNIFSLSYLSPSFIFFPIPSLCFYLYLSLHYSAHFGHRMQVKSNWDEFYPES